MYDVYPKIIFTELAIIKTNYIHKTNVYVHYRHYISNALHKSTPGQPANGQHKCHTKRGLELKKNAVSHTTSEGHLTMLVRDLVC